jgi:RNA polymerase sigma factor (TIGR02999 family)
MPSEQALLEPVHAPMPEITELLNNAKAGNRASEAALLDVVYAELHKLAASLMRRQRPGHTLQTTALVNEAYLRLIGGRPLSFESRGHFFASAAQTMRRILVDHARKHGAIKRAGGLKRVELDANAIAMEEQADDICALDDALQKLAALDPRQVRVVELRFFGGLSVEETAEIMGASESTIKRDWSIARAWLEKELRG